MRTEAGILAAGVAAFVALCVPAGVAAQERDRGVHFASFDVGIGAVFPDGASTGLSYGAGVNVANLLLAGTSARLGFRFWSATDEPNGVDIDDGLLELLLKAHLGSGPVRGYAGVGFGAHFVSARLAASPAVNDERDGFHPGLQLLLGAEAGLGEDQFMAVFLEGVGSGVSDVRHGLLQAGIRVRFDRLGGG